MRRFWINSIPLLVVFFTLIFGFTIVAGAADCTSLKDAAMAAQAAATVICTILGNANDLCIAATAIAGEAWYEYYNAGCP